MQKQAPPIRPDPYTMYRHGDLQALQSSAGEWVICPRCHTPMVKTFMAYEDGSGWLCCFTCNCYHDDKPTFLQEESDG